MKTICLLTSLIFSAITTNSLAEAATIPKVFLLDAPTLQKVKHDLESENSSFAPALARLRSDADAALEAGPFSVTFKTQTPPSGDKHDYMSVGPYWWPDPGKPDGLPYIRRDGEVNPERGDLDNVALGNMVSAVNTLALAWFYTGHEPYGAHAAKLLRVWFLDAKTRMNPNLNYGQAIPGITEGRGIGIIDTKGFADLVDSVGLLQGCPAWTAADQKRLQTWFRDYVHWLLQSDLGRNEESQPNNHGTFFDVQTAAMALFAGQKYVAESLLKQSASRRIDTQIEPDGRQPLELARTRSLSYSLSNLDGMFKMDRLAEEVGLDLWNYRSPDGRSIRNAFNWLLPFFTGQKEWEHKQISDVSDQAWASILRRASVKYRCSSCEEALQKSGKLSPDHRLNLLYPARYH